MTYHYLGREIAEPPTQLSTALKFYVRRFFRIAPLYYLTLLLVIALRGMFLGGYATLQRANPSVWSNPGVYNPANIHYTVTNILLHITFVFGLLPKYSFSTMLPDWSISLEMQYYAAFPLIFLLLRRFGAYVGIVSLLVVLIVHKLFAGLPTPVYAGQLGLFPEPSFLPLKIDLFVAGMMLANAAGLKGKTVSEAIPLGIAAMIIAAREVRTGYEGLILLAVVGSVWYLTIPTIQTTFTRRMMSFSLGNPAAKFAADMSYGVYLLHGLFLAGIGGYLFRLPRFLTLSASHRVALLAVGVVIGTYLAAFICHHAVEKPCIQLGKRIINRHVLRSRISESALASIVTTNCT